MRGCSTESLSVFTEMVLFAAALILKAVRRVDSRGTPGLGGDASFPLLFAMCSVNTQATSCMLDLFMKFKYFNTNLGAAEDLGETRSSRKTKTQHLSLENLLTRAVPKLDVPSREPLRWAGVVNRLFSPLKLH